MSSALGVLEELHRSNLNADTVSLKGLALERLDDAALVFLLDKWPSLRTLDLRDNNLTSLPSDFGSYVPRLVTLDLRGNSFHSIPELSEVLALCSSLQSVSISLRNKTDEKILRVMLPKLQLLNGNPIDTEFVSCEITGRSPLSLDLAFSPTSSSSGSIGSDSPSLRWLDTPPSSMNSAIRPVRSPQEKRELRLQFTASQGVQKPVVDRKAISPKQGLSVRPTELPATISDEKTDWRKLLKNTKPTARNVNGDGQAKGKDEPAASRRCDVQTKALPNATGTRDFIAELKAIVESFHKRPSGKANADEQLLLDQLNRKIDMLAFQLNDLEKTPRNGDSPTDGHVVTASLAARWRLLEAGTTYAAQKTQSVDKSLGAGLARLTQSQTQVVEALLRHVNDAIYAQQKWQAASASQEQVAEQQKQQMKLLLDVAETLEKDLETFQAKFQQEKAQREQAQATTQTLRTECDELRKKLSEKQEHTEAIAHPTASTTNSHGRIRKRTETKSSPRPVSPTQVKTTSKLTAVSKASPPRIQAVEAAAPRSRSPPKAIAPMRCLTQKQLVDLIHCILTSKSKYDARIQAIGAPPETVEQHMYTYLNQRFGLQALIVEYASAIWKGCQMYTRHDNDVAMFHAMMRNQVDEDFVGIKKKLQQAIRELLRAYFVAKFPMKPETGIQKMVEAKLDGGLIQEEEWTELLQYLYDTSDSSILMRLVKRKAESFHSQERQDQSRHKFGKTTEQNVSTASALPFAIFEKLLCDYQLQGRLKLLEGFRELFSTFDSQRVGVVSRYQFREIVAQVAPRKGDGEVEKMMQRVDPFEHDTVTFSDAVKSLLQDIRQHSINRRTASSKAETTSNEARNR